MRRREDGTKVCEQCGAVFGRPRLPSGRLIKPTQFAVRRFCSQQCARLAQMTPGGLRATVRALAAAEQSLAQAAPVLAAAETVPAITRRLTTRVSVAYARGDLELYEALRAIELDFHKVGEAVESWRAAREG